MRKPQGDSRTWGTHNEAKSSSIAQTDGGPRVFDPANRSEDAHYALSWRPIASSAGDGKIAPQTFSTVSNFACQASNLASSPGFLPTNRKPTSRAIDAAAKRNQRVNDVSHRIVSVRTSQLNAGV
jgi:hypothetical protein